MRIKSVQFEPGKFYHIYNHAAQNSLLFREAGDYAECLGLMSEYFNTKDFSMVAFCLMPNHYHIFIRQNGECPIYLIMSKLWFRYSKYYNRKYSGKGSVFSGKAQHKLVDREEYLLRLSAYIHLNPVSAGLANKPQDWAWSNYQEWAGLRDEYPCDYCICKSYYNDLNNYRELMEEIAQDKNIHKYLLD